MPAALDQRRQDVGRVRDERHRSTDAVGPPAVDGRHRLVEVVGQLVDVAGVEAASSPGLVDLDDEGGALVHRDGERLRAAHPAQAGGERHRAGQGATEVLAGRLGEGLVGALDDALRRDVDPRAGGHLAVHRQAGALELAELLPRRPVRHEVGVGDEDTRHVRRGAEHADRLAGLDEQGLVVLEALELGDDGVERLPAAGGAPGSAVHDEVVGVLRHLGVEVVHEHAQGGFLLPALAGELGAAGGANGAGTASRFDGRHVRMIRPAVVGYGIGATQIARPPLDVPVPASASTTRRPSTIATPSTADDVARGKSFQSAPSPLM